MTEAATGEILQIATLSVWVAFMAMLVTIPVAILVGYLLARSKFPGWHLVNAVCHMPLVLPPVITGYLLLQIFRPSGTIGGLLESWFGIGLAFQWTGAALAASVMAFPLVMRPIRLAFESQYPQMRKIAQTLGATQISSFLSISLPLALPGIIAGGVLGFAKAMGEFGATITFVSNIPGETQTLSLAVYSFLQSAQGDTAALVLIVIGLIISFSAILVSEWLSSRFLDYRERGDA